MIHHTPFFCKRKDVFLNFPKKFQKSEKQSPDPPETTAEEAEKQEENAENVWAGQGKEQRGAAKKAGEKEDPELAVAHVQGKEQKAGDQQEAEEGVHQVGQLRPQQPHGPKHRPNQGDSAAEGHGEEELPQLGEDGQVHRSRRARKPPSFLGSS